MNRQSFVRWFWEGPAYRTWILHGILSFFIAWLINPPAAILWYVGKEVESAVYTGDPKLWDRIPDALIPTTIAAFVWWVRG